MSPEAYKEMAETEGQHWWYVGRRSILSEVIRALHLSPASKILEIGAGTGGNLEMLAQFGQVSAIEMDPDACTMCIERTERKFDIREGFCPGHMPFKDPQFDLICLLDVLEHIEEDVKALEELQGLLAPKGKILLTVPAYAWLWTDYDAELHHKRRYSLKELQKKSSSSGFKIIKYSYFNTFFFPLVVLVWLKEKWFGRKGFDRRIRPPIWINRVSGWIFGGERILVRGPGLPFGVSLLCILEKA